jgi:hypothetical protein
MDILPPLIHGTLREHYLLLFGSAGLFALGAGYFGAWLGARRATRAAIRALEARNAEALTAGQVRNLEASIDTIGLEVERIAEAQRFVARVLVERQDAHAAAPRQHRAPDQITPH